MSEIIEKIKAEIEIFNEKRKELVKGLQKEFPAMFKDLFDKSTKIESIGWTQYTPYFADGDECIFSANLDYLYINGNNVDDLNDEDNFFEKYLYAELKTEEQVSISTEIDNKPDVKWKRNGKLGGIGWQYNLYYDENEFKIFNEIKEILQSIPVDFYKDLFGDHCQVTLYKNGRIEVEEYDHE